MRIGNNILVPQIYSDAVIGAGGWMTGCDEAADDGTVLGRCDTAHAHLLAPGANKWVRQMVPNVDLNPTDIDVSPGYNVNIYAEAISKSNSSVRYLVTMGRPWVKKPGATNYTPTNMPKRTTVDGNGESRMCGHPMDVDPDNPAVCLLVLPDGAFITDNYGDNWTAIPLNKLPAPSANRMAIVRFDRSRGLVGGRRQYIYVFIPGSGLYLSSNFGADWTKTSAMPGSDTSASHMKVHPTTGKVVVSGMNTEGDSFIRISSNAGASWILGNRTDASAPQNVKTVAFSGLTDRLYGFTVGGGITISNDGGVEWSNYGLPSQVAADMDIPWHLEDGYKAVGEVVRIPGTENYIMTGGIGAWLIPNPPAALPGYGTPVRFVGKSLGIENMVGTNINYAPDGAMGMTMQDKQTILFPAGKAGRELPHHFGPVEGIYRGVNTDYAMGNTQFWATSVVGLGIGYTQDGGKTWTVNESLRTQTGGNGGGQLCVLTEDIVLAAQLEGGSRIRNALYITRNFRAPNCTWQEVVIGNGEAVNAQFSFFNGAPRKVLIKDQFDPGAVYFYNSSFVDSPDDANVLACQGLWKIQVNLGANVTPTVSRQYANRLMFLNQDAIHNKLVVLGKAGDLAFTGGDNAPWLYRSKNMGVNWTDVRGTDNLGAGDRFAEVFGIASGKARWDSEFPTHYVAGYRAFGATDANGNTDFSRYGLWASYDDMLTWTRLEQFPGGHILHPQDIGASPTNFGEVTIALPGMGAITRYYKSELELV